MGATKHIRLVSSFNVLRIVLGAHIRDPFRSSVLMSARLPLTIYDEHKRKWLRDREMIRKFFEGWTLLERLAG